MSTADKKLTSHARKLFQEFDEDARDWGWQQDQGCGGDVAKSKADYEKSKLALETYILNLQKKASKK